MRKVDHLALDTKRARARMGVERGDNFAGMCDLGFGWRISAIDRRDLIGMDREASDETVAPGAPAVPLEALGIAEIRIDRIDGQDLGGGGGEQACVRANSYGEVQDPSGSLLSVAPSSAERSSAPQVKAIKRGWAGA